MEPILETVELDSEENNELLFKVGIEGNITGPAKVRLVCESDDVSYMFQGRPADDGLVQFIISKSSGLKSEIVYPSRVEVMIENRFFIPVQFNIQLKKTVQVFAEAIQVKKVIKNDDIKVSATPIVVKQKSVPIVIEGPKAIETKIITQKPEIVEQKQTKTEEKQQKKQIFSSLAERYKKKKI